MTYCNFSRKRASASTGDVSIYSLGRLLEIDVVLDVVWILYKPTCRVGNVTPNAEVCGRGL